MIVRGLERFKIKMLLVDTGASKNILYYNCFKEMGLSDHHRKPSTMVLESFTTPKILVKRTIKLLVTMGSDDKIKIEEIKFYVVDIESPSNTTMRMIVIRRNKYGDSERNERMDIEMIRAIHGHSNSKVEIISTE